MLPLLVDVVLVVEVDVDVPLELEVVDAFDCDLFVGGCGCGGRTIDAVGVTELLLLKLSMLPRRDELREDRIWMIPLSESSSLGASTAPSSNCSASAPTPSSLSESESTTASSGIEPGLLVTRASSDSLSLSIAHSFASHTGRRVYDVWGLDVEVGV